MQNLTSIATLGEKTFDYATASVSFMEFPSLTIDVQLTAVKWVPGGPRVLTLFAVADWATHYVENVVTVHPNPTAHCGESLANFLAGDEAKTVLLNPIVQSVQGYIEQLEQSRQKALRAAQADAPKR